MNTGLFELFKAAKNPAIIANYLNGSSFDELIEINYDTCRFRNLFHSSQKYTLPLSEGSLEELHINLTEVLVHPDDKERLCELIAPDKLPQHLASSEVPGLVCDEFRFRLLSGNWCWVEIVLIRGEPFSLPENTCRLFVFDAQVKISRRAGSNGEKAQDGENRNELTGLLHKNDFQKSADKLLKNTSVNWCFIAIDIENFRMFNDWHGHELGDFLMMQIGAELRRVCDSAGGTAGYFGQDDFCLLSGYDIEKIEALYKVISDLVSSHGNAMGFMPAFGISIAEPGVSVRDMLDRAFLAVRYAKQSYHSRIRLFDVSMYKQTEEEYQILSAFLPALKKGEISFYLQPLCRASSGKIVAAEALSRWIKPDGTVVSPGAFIPVLEKHGLITDLDLAIWEEVCKWQRSCIDRGMTPLPVSVNVSAVDILNTDLPATFNKLVQQYDLSRDLIKIEITESAYIDNASLVKNAVQGLREQGFIVLMDDFGSGYSTLNMLKNLNIDIIKLDAQFLHIDESNAEKSIRILESVTNMTKTLRVPIIVEGVENREQTEFLRDLGCRYMQGYYFYRPMPREDFELLLTDGSKTDTSGITFKASRQFHLREILESNVYSDSMLNNILGPCAFYALHDNAVDITRFNEQFYEVVNVPDFHDRLLNIERFLPPYDQKLILTLLDQAEKDRLNGAKGLLHFYLTNGNLTTYFMRFFYLREENGQKIFFGAAQNITKIATLERQMDLLARCSPDTVIFLRRRPNGTIRFDVLFNGLEREIGLSVEKLREQLNADACAKTDTDSVNSAYSDILERISHSESFEITLHIQNTDGSPVTLRAYANHVMDDTGTLDYILTLRYKPEETE